MKRIQGVVPVVVPLLGLVVTACSASLAAPAGGLGPAIGTVASAERAAATAAPLPSPSATATAPLTQPAVSLTRTDVQGAVTVAVTPLNLDNPGDTLDFDVAMNTHSVNLDMDLAGLASLATDTGRAVQASTWQAPSGGHHVDGTLSFPARTDGELLLQGTRQLTLTIRNVDAAERTFTWELP
jgi:hypothetical protein